MRNMSEDIDFRELHLENLRLEDLHAYVEENGWKDLKYPGDRLLVFEGPESDDGRPILLSLPAKRGFRDTDDRLLDAVHLLAAVEQTTPYDIVQKIKARERDTMRLRLRLPSDSLPSVVAIFSIIHGWRDLITFSACMEQERKPYFEEALPVGRRQAQRFWFGHTFQGSFGLSIESLIFTSSSNDQTSTLQQVEDLSPPIGRRVIERITRGLLFAQEAKRRNSSRVISDNFGLGLNANMCNALLEVFKGIQNVELEYTVLWSSRLQPSHDIFQAEPILLQEDISSYVRDAARILRNAPHETQKAAQIRDALVQGPIVEMNAGDTGHRTIKVLWKERQEHVIISLELEDYQVACDAHKEDLSISIRGMLKRGKGRKLWTLTNPYDFTVEQ